MKQEKGVSDCHCGLQWFCLCKQFPIWVTLNDNGFIAYLLWRVVFGMVILVSEIISIAVYLERQRGLGAERKRELMTVLL